MKFDSSPEKRLQSDLRSISPSRGFIIEHDDRFDIFGIRMKSQEQSIILRCFFFSPFCEKPLIGAGRSFPVDRWASQIIVQKMSTTLQKTAKHHQQISEKICLFKKGGLLKLWILQTFWTTVGFIILGYKTNKSYQLLRHVNHCCVVPGQGPAYASVFVQDEDAQELQPGFWGLVFVAS